MGVWAPLALLLAQSEDFWRGGLRPGEVSLGFSPRRDAPRMAAQFRKPHPRNPPPLLILRGCRERSLAVQSMVVVKVALPFVSF